MYILKVFDNQAQEQTLLVSTFEIAMLACF